MHHILVCHTGGTIGSKKSGNAIQVQSSISHTLIEQYNVATKQNSEQIHFDCIQPFSRLSENLTPADWITIANHLRSCKLTDYEGIIITHGTDTLAYTAAALSYLCCDLQLPIVLIASKYPLEDPRSKGLSNFIHAVQMICHNPIHGVTVVFEDDQGRVLVHLGTRILQSEHFTDEYASAYRIPLGFIHQGHLQLQTHPINPTMVELNKRRVQPLSSPAFSSEIVHLKPYPGLNYDYITFDSVKPKAIYHDVYHSGTACTVDQNPYSLLRFMERCSQDNIPVYIGPIKNLTGDLYSTTVALLEAGAIGLENMTVEASLVKLMLAYGSLKHEAEIDAFLQKNCHFEQIPVVQLSGQPSGK